MKKKNKILIASDHAGFILKKKLVDFFKKEKKILYDIGTSSENSVDYPDYAHKLCEQISKGNYNSGVLICGSGIGMSIVANRYQKIRAALCLNEKMVKLCRRHNDANVLVLGSRLISYDEATKCILCFIKTSFEAGRHTNRLNKINKCL